MWQFRLNAIAPCSWTLEKSQVESCEHQDNADIHCQPFPESVSEEHDIYTDYDGCHRHHVKHDSYLSAHLSSNLILPKRIDEPHALKLSTVPEVLTGNHRHRCFASGGPDERVPEREA